MGKTTKKSKKDKKSKSKRTVEEEPEDSHTQLGDEEAGDPMDVEEEKAEADTGEAEADAPLVPHFNLDDDIFDSEDDLDDILFTYGKEAEPEMKNWRRPDTANIECLVVGYPDETAFGALRPVYVGGKAKKGFKIMVVVTGFPNFAENGEKLKWVDPDTKTTIQMRGTHRQGDDAKNLRIKKGRAEDTEEKEDQPITLSIGDYIGVKCWESSFKSIAVPGDVIRLNGVTAGLWDYVKDKKKMRKQTKKGAGDAKASAEAEEENDGGDETLDMIKTSKQFNTRLITKLYHAEDPCALLRERVKIASKLDVEEDSTYYTILYVGAGKGLDPSGDTVWQSKPLCHRHLSDFKRTRALTEEQQREYPPGKEAIDVHYKKMDTNMTFVRWNAKENPRRLTAQGKLRPHMININFSDEVCESLLLITRQSVWPLIIESVHPALGFAIVAKYDDKSHGFDINLSKHADGVQGIIKFRAVHAFVNLKKFLRTNGFLVNAAWAIEHFSHNGGNGTPILQNTADDARGKRVAAMYPDKLLDAEVLCLSNLPGTMVLDDSWEYRVITSEWFNKAPEFAKTENSGMVAQLKALRAVGKLPMKQAISCLEDVTEENILSVSKDSLRIVYAIKKDTVPRKKHK